MANKRKCCNCKTPNSAEDYILGPGGIQSFCNFDCMTAYAYANKSKGKSIKAKASRKDLAERKKKLKSRNAWVQEAQAVFNKYIRIRDTLDGCISCDKTRQEVEEAQGWKVGGCWDAGHYIPRAVKQQLKFNTYGCHKQCKSCNGGSDKFSSKAATVGAKYRINLIDKIGLNKVEELEGNNELDKMDIDYLKRVKRIFGKRAKHLTKLRGY